MRENTAIGKKLYDMTKHFGRFKKFFSEVTLKTYKENPPIRQILKKEIRLIVESATEINNLILAGIKADPVKDYFNSFMALAEKGIIDKSYALQIASSTGIRNLLAHGYDKTDEMEIYKAVPDMISSYERYFKQIYRYLEG